MHITTVYNLDNLDRSTNGNERRQKYRRTWRILCYYILCYYEWTYFQNICQHIHRRQVTSRPCSMYRARSCIEINRSSWPPYIYIVRPRLPQTSVEQTIRNTHCENYGKFEHPLIKQNRNYWMKKL